MRELSPSKDHELNGAPTNSARCQSGRRPARLTFSSPQARWFVDATQMNGFVRSATSEACILETCRKGGQQIEEGSRDSAVSAVLTDHTECVILCLLAHSALLLQAFSPQCKLLSIIQPSFNYYILLNDLLTNCEAIVSWCYCTRLKALLSIRCG